MEIGFTGNGWVSSRRRIRSAAVPRLSEMDTALALEATLAWPDKKLTPRAVGCEAPLASLLRGK